MDSQSQEEFALKLKHGHKHSKVLNGNKNNNNSHKILEKKLGDAKVNETSTVRQKISRSAGTKELEKTDYPNVGITKLSPTETSSSNNKETDEVCQIHVIAKTEQNMPGVMTKPNQNEPAEADQQKPTTNAIGKRKKLFSPLPQPAKFDPTDIKMEQSI